MVAHDYMVAYEGVCDSSTQSCFVGCNDDACADAYYYAKVQKYAVDLYAQCGKDITGCEAANACLPLNDRKCSITYCDPGTDGDACEMLTEESETQNGSQASPAENESQQSI